jgi:methyl-accepting chemotaxis protein
MDEMTQQNALLADQSAKVARDLQQDTTALTTMVAAFTLADSSGFEARIANDLRQSVPHLARPTAMMPKPVLAASRPRRVAGGGSADGWSEF